MSRWQEPAPGEHEARDRSWRVVRAAFAAREPVPRKRARWPLIALVAGAAIAAAALSPPGLAVLGSVRDAVRGEPKAAPALFALPSGGRLLVDSEGGTWVVQPDGSKRLLRGYRDAAWSPRGLYLAAAKGNELVALEPGGDVHWSLARPGRIAHPQWSDETPPCCRIAYLAGDSVRVVNGDGSGDRLWAAGAAPVAPAWRPGSHVLASVGGSGTVTIGDVDRGRPVTRIDLGRPATQLAWTADGRRLVVVDARNVGVYTPAGRLLRRFPFGGGTVSVAPASERLAVLRRVRGSGGEVRVVDLRTGTSRALFSPSGDFSGTAWSPDGRRLLVAWPAADQWLFLPEDGRGRVRAVANITRSFGRGSSIAGWCCP